MDDLVPSSQPQASTSNMPSIDTANPDKADAKSHLNAEKEPETPLTTGSLVTEVDEFGLPIRKPFPLGAESEDATTEDEGAQAVEKDTNGHMGGNDESALSRKPHNEMEPKTAESESEDEFADAQPSLDSSLDKSLEQEEQAASMASMAHTAEIEEKDGLQPQPQVAQQREPSPPQGTVKSTESSVAPASNRASITKDIMKEGTGVTKSTGHSRGKSSVSQGISEWSHQHTAVPAEVPQADIEEDEWQVMPAYASYDMYDDDNKLIAREVHESAEEGDAYAGLGGAGRGYTRVQLDEDAQSATSLDENTKYLFKEADATGVGELEDEEARDAVSQMQATKDLLTEGQRIAYVGMTRLIISIMIDEATVMAANKNSKKEVRLAAEAMHMWSQKMMVRLYAHMDISSAEQIMIEQLVQHGVRPSDLTPTLMQNARVKNPMAEDTSTSGETPSRPASVISSKEDSTFSASPPRTRVVNEEEPAASPPPYQEHAGEDLPEVRTPSQLPTTANIDIDLRWTVLCDLFLVLIADSVYDARSRVLLERVGDNMKVPWVEICRFEKRVTDALEMQQSAEKENWNEDVHKENRRKMALKKRYMLMGLATVGGGLVIGLSAGLLAPVIGAGLAAGFTTIGVAGTGGFLAGAGGAAIITSSAAASGGIIAVRAANRRTGAVKTFEYRPLHNNKRVNLIVTVSGWMTGKVDDVRLPYSTVDPIMGDIYSVLWEPEMLQSMGDTINILATEALTQGLQQVLGSTILMGLMAALQLPVVLTKLAYLIDNPWTVSLDRANSAGLILADSLIDRNLGTRPITFVGYSLGSRVIFSCLKELARKGAYGLVQNVYLFGSPIVANKDDYMRARSVVAGRFVNGYARNDWILGYLFRLTSGGLGRVAGLAPVEEIPGMENVDVTELVVGHMAYRTAMPRLLMEVGWLVESDEFTEIEDPDPENHAARQRELINEIEEARKEFDKKEKESKGSFGFFSRKKKAAIEKKEWETYEEVKAGPETRKSHDEDGSNNGVLFDIDAIRAELASEQMEVRELPSTLPPMKLDVRELQSTLPPMKLDLNAPGSLNPRNSLRETKSHDPSTMLKAYDSRPSPAHSPRHSSSDLRPPATSIPLYHLADEDEIQMTFDTSYQSPPRSATHSTSDLPLRTSASPHPPPADPTDGIATLQRPELKSSNTLQTGLSIASLEHNTWADEDEDFGREKEIEMTFA